MSIPSADRKPQSILSGSMQSVAGGSSERSVAGSAGLEHSISESLLGITSGNLAKFAFTVLAVVRSEKMEEQKGQFRNHLRTKLGEVEWKNLKKDAGISLERIFYCQVQLRHWAESTERVSQVLSAAAKQGSKSAGTGVVAEELEKIKEVKHLINHDFLVLEIKRGDSERIYIKAEKNGINAHDADPEAEVGITMSRQVKVPDESYIANVKPYIIDCGSKSMRLAAIMGILQAEDPNYHVRDKNCWNYARNTTKLLLAKCVEVTDVGDTAEKTRLQKEKDELETNLRRYYIVDLSKDLVKWISDQSDRRKWTSTSK